MPATAPQVARWAPVVVAPVVAVGARLAGFQPWQVPLPVLALLAALVAFWAAWAMRSPTAWAIALLAGVITGLGPSAGFVVIPALLASALVVGTRSWAVAR